LTNADDGRERLDGGTNATTTGNDERTTTTTTGAGEEAMRAAGEETTRAAGNGCTEARMAGNTPLRCQRRRRRRETTSRREGTVKTTTDTGGVRSEGRRGRGRRRGCDAEDDGGVADRCTAWRDGRPNNSGEADGEVRGDGVPAKPRSERGGGLRHHAKGGMAAPADARARRKGAAGGDVDEEEGEAGAGDGVPAKLGRRRGLAGKEDGTPVPGEVVATSAGAPGTWQRRPEAESWRQHHGCRRGGTSGGLRGK
jgi:hypothetical protein